MIIVTPNYRLGPFGGGYVLFLLLTLGIDGLQLWPRDS